MGTFKPVRKVDPNEISTATSKPIPSDKEKLDQSMDTAATAVRYGVPIAAGLAMPATIPGLLGQGAVTAASEMTARQLEEASSDPQMRSLWDDFKASMAVGATDAGLGLAGKAVGFGLRKIGSKLFLPRTLPKDIETAQSVLGSLPPEVSKKWDKFRGKSQPFSLSLGQLNSEEKSFVTWLESIARSGMFGRRKMANFDQRNIDEVTKVFEKYISSRSSELSGPEFGAFMKRVLGEVGSPGEIFNPVESYRAFLYRRFDNALSLQADATVNLKKLQKTLSSSTDKDILNVYNELKTLDLLPNLKTTKEAWDKIPATKANDILRVINSKWSAADEAYNAKLGLLKSSVEPEFDKFINSVPQLKEMRQVANTYYGAKERALYNVSLKAIRRTIARSPSGVLSLFDVAKGAPAATYDKLMTFKKALYFSAAAPPSARIGKSAANQTAVSFPKGGGRAAIEKEYHEGVIKPLRHRFITASTTNGVLDSRKLLKQIEKIESDAPELLSEVWGTPVHIEKIKKLATTLDALQNKPEMSSIFIQLAQASAIAGTLTLSGYMGDDPKIMTGLAGTAGILLGPRMLAAVFSSPALTKSLTDGINAGIRSPKLSIALRKIAALEVGSDFWKSEPSADAIATYTSVPQEG